ncbi:nucleotidyltransferase family protein [Streptococcus oricebi]|uniref:Nucleotidyltransferase family protein n=1 Tax=Streptococcus oricebi TaxID=1547447 RepID=A0ABS5B6R2_9STRE|nr:nucleotidyltransferase family protein [Streptococcus oricebi]MBP2624198.1 hypothetical protein [Streptococcus oricebi]
MEKPAEILAVFAADQDLMELLRIIRDLKLKDSWLCAGSVRNFLWNYLSGRPALDWQTDVDVIFFDPAYSAAATRQVEERLKRDFPSYQWEVRNQVLMHQHSPHTAPYQSSRDAMSKYPERCTAVGLRLLANNQLEAFAPYGWQDILNFRIGPTPHFWADQERRKLYLTRLQQKNWQQKWPQLQLYFPEKASPD